MRIHMNVLLKNSESISGNPVYPRQEQVHIISWNETLIVIQSGGKLTVKLIFEFHF